jgi:orotidine-5'-phosphate decarboxylase
MEERIIVSLDVPTKEQALQLAALLHGRVRWFKIGFELMTSVGPTIIEDVRKRGAKVFLDGKFHDIPNTVGGAARAAVRMGAAMFNVHTSGGSAMMRAALEAAESEANRLGSTRPLILGVTVLTSIDQHILNEELMVPGEVGSHVVHLAELAHAAGLDGVVASPREVELIRAALPPGFLIVTPGIRPMWASTDDQRRVTTPAQAITKGATHLVIGRPITRPPQSVGGPQQAVELILKELSSMRRE